MQSQLQKHVWQTKLRKFTKKHRKREPKNSQNYTNKRVTRKVTKKTHKRKNTISRNSGVQRTVLAEASTTDDSTRWTNTQRAARRPVTEKPSGTTPTAAAAPTSTESALCELDWNQL